MMHLRIQHFYDVLCFSIKVLSEKLLQFHVVYLCSVTSVQERASLRSQIMEFGQIPKQLFLKPHPARFSKQEVPEVNFESQEEEVEIENEASDVDPDKEVISNQEENDPISKSLTQITHMSPVSCNPFLTFHKNYMYIVWTILSPILEVTAAPITPLPVLTPPLGKSHLCYFSLDNCLPYSIRDGCSTPPPSPYRPPDPLQTPRMLK